MTNPNDDIESENFLIASLERVLARARQRRDRLVAAQRGDTERPTVRVPVFVPCLVSHPDPATGAPVDVLQ